MIELFLIEIFSGLRWHPGWASGLGGQAFASGSGQSGGQALGPGPGPCPTPQPIGWTVPVLEMTRPSRALAAPGWHASMQGPADRSRRWGSRCCGSPVRWGAATAIFASLGPPEDPLEDLLLGSSPFSLAFIWAAGCMAVVSPSLVRAPIGPPSPLGLHQGRGSNAANLLIQSDLSIF